MADNIVFNLWKDYRQHVLPPTASETQVIETRRAFYAGAHAILNGTASLMSDDNEMTDSDEAVMLSIRRELDAFTEDVSRGRA